MQRLLDALHEGRCYLAVDGYEKAAQFRFELQMDGTAFNIGSRVAFHQDGRIHVQAPSSGPVLIRLYRNGRQIAETTAQHMDYDLSEPGVYHAEAYQIRSRLFRSAEPRFWILSNPIWVEE